MGKSRNNGLDLLRVIAMLMVIAVHVPIRPQMGSFDKAFSLLVRPNDGIFYTSNLLFFMISGYFNLDYSFNSASDWGTFYKKRFISIVFPYLIAVVALYIWSDVYITGSITTKFFLKNIYIFHRYQL